MSEAPKRINLFEYSEEQLLEEKCLTHYEILGLPIFCTQDDVKKAFRKASLRYHPDKLQSESEHYVFLAVKDAHDTLFDNAKRQAYDSTVMPFDDSIPPSRDKLVQEMLYQDEDFYETFGPVFQRNLRFDARLRPEAVHKKQLHTNKHKKQNKPHQPPHIGTDDTPLQQVHHFYEYWIHFESWRDFTQQATDELNVENELEQAESRYEKRWLQREIDKRAKQLKKQEMGRIQLLVERAMEADPRLRRERQEQVLAKEKAKQDRIAAQERKQQDAERLVQEQQAAEEAERQRRAEEKSLREQEKKQIRKARQQLRRMASSSFDKAPNKPWADAYDMNVDVDLLCSSLSLQELRDLAAELNDIACDNESLTKIKQRAEEAAKNQQAETTAQKEDSTTNGSKKDANKASSRSAWTKDELSALAKAVKKFPPGGASRWEQIALFVNNLCKQAEPRSKEECIEKYNQIARSGSKPQVATTATTTTTTATKITTTGDEDDAWTAEQDQQLQEGLAKYPATMDKNERWTAIAKCVPGKTKKQCVQRFKAIRDALKNRK